MKSTPFWRFDTAGNTTLLLADAASISKAMLSVPAEQAGAYHRDELVMAGGEFCANACLALAAWFELTGNARRRFRIAGRQVASGCTGSSPAWIAWAEFSTSGFRSEQCPAGTVIHLPGISHVLAECDEFPDPVQAHDIARKIWQTGIAETVPARGIIWWNPSTLGIYPLVSVPSAGSLNIEGACGSGTIALSLLLGEGKYSISQPSGLVLETEVKQGCVRLKGPVRLLAAGDLWPV